MNIIRKKIHSTNSLEKQKVSYKYKKQFKFLVTGCSGQVGKALIPRLYKDFGVENVVCSDLFEKPSFVKGEYTSLDVVDTKSYENTVKNNEINYILHLAGILSGIL